MNTFYDKIIHQFLPWMLQSLIQHPARHGCASTGIVDRYQQLMEFSRSRHLWCGGSGSGRLGIYHLCTRHKLRYRNQVIWLTDFQYSPYLAWWALTSDASRRSTQRHCRRPFWFTLAGRQNRMSSAKHRKSTWETSEGITRNGTITLLEIAIKAENYKEPRSHYSIMKCNIVQ